MCISVKAISAHRTILSIPTLLNNLENLQSHPYYNPSSPPSQNKRTHSAKKAQNWQKTNSYAQTAP
jgi:hypothetical protein